MGAVARLAGPFSHAGAQAVSWPTHGWRRSSPEAQGWTQGRPEHSTTSASGRFRSADAPALWRLGVRSARSERLRSRVRR
jgi:hypothetical protein